MLVLALVPATALAKPAFYRPRETVDSETLATAATVRLTAAIRARNVSAISAVLGTQFTNNGLSFPDAACTKRFESGGEIKGAEVSVFARCLAGLKLQMTTRKAAARDGGLLTADPGIEIELAFKGETLRWIGFPSQAGTDRAIPMLTAQALEALRTGGTTVVDAKVAQALDLELAQSRALVATAWIKVCLDPKGEITRISSIQSSSAVASGAFLAAVTDWKFKPFTIRGTPTAACSASLLAYPGSRAPLVEAYPSSLAPSAPITRTYEFEDDDFEIMGGLIGGPMTPPPPPPPAPSQTVPPSLLENLRVSGNKLIVPDAPTKATMLQARTGKVVASMKLCIDDKGTVASVAQLKSSGYPAYDRKIMGEMRQWIYKPYKQNGRAVPVCTAVTFIYDASRPSP
jgi:hypothetical protein